MGKYRYGVGGKQNIGYDGGKQLLGEIYRRALFLPSSDIDTPVRWALYIQSRPLFTNTMDLDME